ncbi:MAG: WbqC family protein [Bacteroidales bacterium]|nr:WbqC family protein [Bacteroidales bacterium]
MLLGIAYFPPVSYFALIAKGMVLSPEGSIPSVVYIEAKENYQKQSWRNRCRIYAAGGPAYLNFPVVHEGTHELPITGIRVDYSTPWVLKTKRAITSAYESSAYFDHYKDDLFGILDSHPETLFELDLRIIRFFLSKTGLLADIRLTDEYHAPSFPGVYVEDYREVLHPKRPNTVLRDLGLEKPYFQVFARKYGFIPDLSIMDLLFNEGPDSILYLKTSSREWR